MNIGIYDVYDGRPMPHQKIYEQILDFNDINYKLLSIRDNSFWDDLGEIDLLIYRWPNNDNQHLLSNIIRPIFENLRIKYFPDQSTSWHYDDKLKQYYLIKLFGSDVGAISVDTKIFFHKEAAFEFIGQCDFPIVAKLSKGASSSNVVLLKNIMQAKKHIKRSFSSKGISPNYLGSQAQFIKTLNFSPKRILTAYLKRLKRTILQKDSLLWQSHKNYVLFQDFLSGNEYDTRVTTVGRRVHAFRRFVRKGDFRASGGEEWDVNPDKIDKRMLKIAMDFSKKMKFQTMAYDFIYDKNEEPRIIEMSYMYGQPGFPDFMNGYWDNNLKWIEGRFWPQFFELKDLLGLEKLQCPEIQIPTEWITNRIV